MLVSARHANELLENGRTSTEFTMGLSTRCYTWHVMGFSCIAIRVNGRDTISKRVLHPLSDARMKKRFAWTSTYGLFVLNDTRAFMTWCMSS